MPYEPTPIIIYNDLQVVPPEVADLNTEAWEKANTNFEDIATAIGSALGAVTGLRANIPAAGSAGKLYFATDAPATLYLDTGTEWKATLTFGTSTGTVAEGNDSRFTDASNHASAANPHSGHEVTSAKNAASGYCGLDANAKVSTNQLPSAVFGALNYQGIHSAAGGTYPANPAKGYYWVISVEGTIAAKLYRVNDWLVYDGTVWGKIDNATVVASVAGKTGAVTLTTADVADSSNARYCTDAQKTVIGNTSGTNSGNETATTAGALINSATAKNAPVDADMLGLMDSESTEPANVLKKLSWAYVKSVLKTYFDGLYTLSNLGGVPTSRTVAGHALTDNVAISASDVGLGNVTNAAQLTAAQLAAASGVASLDASSKVVQDPASKAQASGVASLDASSKVVQDPANATATATGSKIPIADANGKLDTWVTDRTGKAIAMSIVFS